MQVLIAISGFCPRIGNVPCTTPFDFLFVISIHVPTWGTTLSISTNLFALIFQSTFPRGERLYNNTYLNHFKYFNPRSLVGNDGVKAQWGGSSYISIHVPSWGTTASGDPSTAPDRISIHVPSWGTTTQLRGNVPRYEHFNPRSLVGNDRIWQNTLPSRWKFQSTVPRGERLYTDMQKLIMFNFNPRSLVGNDPGSR